MNLLDKFLSLSLAFMLRGKCRFLCLKTFSRNSISRYTGLFIPLGTVNPPMEGERSYLHHFYQASQVYSTHLKSHCQIQVRLEAGGGCISMDCLPSGDLRCGVASSQADLLPPTSTTLCCSKTSASVNMLWTGSQWKVALQK